ncbi:ribonuclease HII [Parvibaculum sp.]|uniref:ribonuclease HII n=1 Tax=Parvibaculum sp. TaxID=2024848 RepID=UPI001B22CDE5|nr:ribonuclease HII [Parvibaculum sp.]MBO6666962.1 ribonuclease HII [Parvibaculum sp.]MBO6690406.1 ribonuclease HII [Parvibaculum sp.]MBO6713583.1 ribonuclease HII [Parvibaculum sp.]
MPPAPKKKPQKLKPKQKPKAKLVVPMPDYAIETEEGAPARLVCGVDEAGRGPLAGPVVAAAVIIDISNCPQGLNDSKKLDAARREALLAELETCAEIGIGIASVEEIDEINILHATMLAMTRAVASLPRAPHVALIDGNRCPPGLVCSSRAVIGGDGLALSIAAASIAAKVTRDRMMAALAEAHPGYGFENHMGYGTPAHLDALSRLGASPVHRRSFAPIRKILSPDLVEGLDLVSDESVNLLIQKNY